MVANRIDEEPGLDKVNPDNLADVPIGAMLPYTFVLTKEYDPKDIEDSFRPNKEGQFPFLRENSKLGN